MPSDDSEHQAIDDAKGASSGPRWERELLIAVTSSVALTALLFLIAKWIRENHLWPTSDTDGLVLTGVFVLGLTPLMAVAVHALIQQGGSVSVAGVSFDIAAARVASKAQTAAFRSLAIDTNLGVPGQSLDDSSSEEILDVIDSATGHDFVVVDLGAGWSWWETRLFVLAEGADRLGHPEALVFLSHLSDESDQFVGWCVPGAVLDALMARNHARGHVYRSSYDKTERVITAWRDSIASSQGQPAVPPEVQQMGPPWNYSHLVYDGAPDGLRKYGQEQLLAWSLGEELERNWRDDSVDYEASERKRFPGAVWVTPIYLEALLNEQLHRESIDQAAPRVEQLNAYIDSSGDYVATTESGHYKGMLRRSDVRNALVDQMIRETVSK